MPELMKDSISMLGVSEVPQWETDEPDARAVGAWSRVWRCLPAMTFGQQ
ncbi:MAG: hypothetical protein LC126_05055 [Bryobacterales bacterium]|nr:hypothetical protein [Bryobacterales bacterium]